jgi:subtilisin family serine protease
MRTAGSRLLGFVSIATLALGAGTDARATESPAWRGKIHPAVLDRAAAGPAEFLVVLAEQADLSGADRLRTKEERGAWVVARLREVATRAQAPLVKQLAALGVEHRPFWIVNMIWARGGLDEIERIAARPDVRRLDGNPSIRLDEPGRGLAEGRATAPAGAIEWGLQKVGAPALWSMGYRGAGVVVGGQDTGYEWAHGALQNQYRGWDGATASHDYNWHDAIHSGGGSCGADSPFPCDDHNHGTHTMGTMVGDDGGSNQIGMAPAARWIGCRNMDVGDGTPATYTECFQWFVAPTNLAGQNPDPSRSPDVINNSWSCPQSEGCSWDTLQTVVENTRAAGILVVVSAGNAGSGCGTVGSPPAIYAASLSVGATDSSDVIASFSSRGPVTVDGSDRLKPDVSAPGVSVRSSVRGGGYAVFNGTSMAGPHVAGLAALLMSARPDLRGRVSELETLLKLSAMPLASTQVCGGISGSAIPNPIYGYGRIDAVETILGDADVDGTDNLQDCRPADPSVWSIPDPARDLRLTGATPTAISWSPPADPGATMVLYDVVRSQAANDFSAATCLVADSSGTSAPDAAVPGQIFYYLVRAENSCGGSLGTDSSGAPRSARVCVGPGG